MIPRENRCLLLTICGIFLLLRNVKGERTYDTSEWIPITPDNLQSSASEVLEQKAPNERVLNLDAPAQRFFPEQEYELRKRKSPEQYLRETPPKKVLDPRPRKLRYPAEYKLETPPPPPVKGQPQLNYYNGQQLTAPYVEQPSQRQSAYIPLQRPGPQPHVPVPSVNPRAPSPGAPNLYEKYQLPFNSSFYQSLNPTTINNEFYQAIGNRSEPRPLSNPAPIPQAPVEQESVQLVYVPVENLKGVNNFPHESVSKYQNLPDAKGSEVRIPLQTFSSNVPLGLPPTQELTYSTPETVPSYLKTATADQGQLVSREPKPASYQGASYPTPEKSEFGYSSAPALPSYQAEKTEFRSPLPSYQPEKSEFRYSTAAPLPSYQPEKTEIRYSTATPLQSYQPEEKAEHRYTTSSPLPPYQPEKSGFKYSTPSSLPSYQELTYPKQEKFLARPVEKVTPDQAAREQKFSYSTPAPLYPFKNNKQQIIDQSPKEQKIAKEQTLLYNTPSSIPSYQSPFSPTQKSTREQSFPYSTPGSLPLYREPDFARQEKYLSSPFESSNKQTRLENIQKDYLQQSLQAHKLQKQFSDDINPLKQQEVVSTTQKPKLKPHQPPLAVFLESHDSADITDVLNELKGAKTISVQDSISVNSPKIFIGPSNLDSPGYYTKFPLPYLNNINGNRIERKIEQLPFFVAPVSYDAPSGYSKIPLPSPHIGSVVVSIPVAKPTTPEPSLYSPSLDAYEVFSPSSRTQYQSTTDSTAYLEPVKEIFTQTRQQEYRTPYSSHEASKVSATQQPQLPNVSPIDVAIKEFELHQINDELEEHNKVKHSTTTRRPQEDLKSSRTRGRYTYEEEPTSERTRGRARGRGRSTTRSTTTTTTTTTTVSPVGERYTVLEEFVAKTQATPTEDYKSSLKGLETEAPRRSSSPFSANPYLPEEYFETGRSQSPLFDYELPKFGLDDISEKTTEIESIPANVFSLGPSKEYFEDPKKSHSGTRLKYDNIEEPVSATEKVKLEGETTTPSHRFRPTEVTNYENREPNQVRTSAKPAFSYEVDEDDIRRPLYRQPETYERPPVTTPVAVEDQKAKQSAEEPTSFLNNLYQPNFDQTYISLQDQAVRSLLVPNLLAPSTKPHSSAATASTRVEPVAFTESSTTEATTTTTKATRVRGRGRARVTTAGTTASPRRATSERRRPVARVSTEKPVVSTEYSRREESAEPVQQKFRTRGRPLQNEISTTESELKVYKEESISERTFEPSNSRETYGQRFDPQPAVTAIPEIELNYNQQIYSLPTQVVTEQQPLVLDYDNTRTKLVTEVQTDAPDQRKAEFIPKRVEEQPIVRYNIKSGGVLNNNAQPSSTTTEPPVRVRGRGRSRFATSSGTTTTTSRSVRISARPTNAPTRASPQKEEEPQEFFGFIRQPGYSPSNINIQATKPKPDESVRFVGEIRPKYTPRTTTAKYNEEDVPETHRPRIRARTRAPVRKSGSEDNKSSEQQVSNKRPSAAALRTRGRSHYRGQDNVKRESEDEDVASQNYPINFLQKLDATTVRESEDQAAHASFYTPTYLPHPNSLSTVSQVPFEETTPSIHELSSETQKMSSAISPEKDVEKKKKKGSWKLVKTRPADPLDVSESQNYQSVLNAFGSIEKVEFDPKSIKHELDVSTETKYEEKIAATTTTPSPSKAKAQENIFEAIYEMFGAFTKASAKNSSESAEATTTTAPSIFPEEITEEVPTSTSLNEEITETILPQQSSSTESTRVEASTTTSTEVSHETEICYKGRCVKSKDRNKKKGL